MREVWYFPTVRGGVGQRLARESGLFTKKQHHQRSLRAWTDLPGFRAEPRDGMLDTSLAFSAKQGVVRPNREEVTEDAPLNS